MVKAPRALVVDDNEDIQMLLTFHLNNLGFTVRTASHGLQAMEEILQHGPMDIVLSDLQMPGMSGLELFAWMKESGFKIPFILISGSVVVTRNDVMDHGVSDFIEKPFTAKMIQSVLDRHLELPSTNEAQL